MKLDSYILLDERRIDLIKHIYCNIFYHAVYYFIMSFRFDVNWGSALFLSAVVIVKLITNSINSNSANFVFRCRKMFQLQAARPIYMN